MHTTLNGRNMSDARRQNYNALFFINIKLISILKFRFPGEEKKLS